MLFGSVVEKRFPQKGIIRGRGEGRANYFLWAGGILTGVMLLLILVGYVWTPYSTTEMSGADKFLGPCLAHPLGTDNFGRDLLSRIMEGAGSTFSIALCVVLIGGVVGTIIGCLTGYFGGVADLILMRVCDAITAFPSILLFGSVVEKRFPQKGIIRGRGEGRANYFLWAGGILTGVMLLLILVGYVWTPYSTTEMSGADKFLGPCLAHPLGTDNFGRDLLSRIMEGAGSTFSIALCVVLIGGVVGTIIGCLTGYFGGVADLILMRVCDAITAFPSILLALVLITIIGQGKYPIILILGILFIPSFARVVRGEVAKQRNMNYVASARLMGASHLRIIFRHILPNTVQVLLPILAIGFNNAVLAEASMSYLGVGVLPPDASLGRMLAEAQTYLGRAPWYALFVGLAIVLLILGLSLLTEGLQQKRRS